MSSLEFRVEPGKSCAGNFGLLGLFGVLLVIALPFIALGAVCDLVVATWKSWDP